MFVNLQFISSEECVNMKLKVTKYNKNLSLLHLFISKVCRFNKFYKAIFYMLFLIKYNSFVISWTCKIISKKINQLKSNDRC